MTPTDKPTPARPVRIGGLMRCCLDRPRAVSREGPPMTDDKPTPAAWQQYRRKQIAELRPFVVGENLSWGKVSISAEDVKAGSPKPGDMIARNPKNHDDQWLVAADYFADNFEPLSEPTPASPSAEPPYESEHDIGEQLSLDTQCVHNFALTRWDCLRCTVAAAERAAASKARAEVERLREERDATKASAEAWEWTTRRNADAADALRTQLEEARELLRDFRDNHDCDEDAHRYRNEDTQCRCCMAGAFLAAYPAEPPAPEACSHGISFAVDCPACTAIYYNTPAPEEPKP